jgi:hypothetical protein
MPNDKSTTLLVRTGALIALIGFLLSGPVSVTAVYLWKPQPSWVSVELFSLHHHWVQVLPYFFGFILLAGILALVTAWIRQGEPVFGFRFRLCYALTIVFITLVAYNYILQTTFIPHLLKANSELNEPVIAAITMANPASLGWALEMWGYAILGVVTWILAALYKDTQPQIYYLMKINGLLSVGSLVWAIWSANWLLTPLGIACYGAWNLVMIVLLVLIIRYESKRMK